MLKKNIDKLLSKKAALWVQDDGIQRHGISKIMRWAKRYNRWRYAGRIKAHQKAYDSERETLMVGNGAPSGFKPRNIMKDGWAIDTSGTLPHLAELLEQGGEMVRERGGKTHSDVQQPFLRNIMFPGDMGKYPAVLDFITSHEVMGTVMDYMQTIPVFSQTRPPGVRFMESNDALDPDSDGPYRSSQFYHLDVHDTPLVYVLVLIEDVTIKGGPWTFLPMSVSDRASEALRYQEEGVPYRVTDEAMYAVVDPEEAITFAYPKGTVLFIDSSRCFHYGSRKAIDPRFQLMYAYTSACRADFSQTFMGAFRAPIDLGDSRLRKMVLSKR